MAGAGLADSLMTDNDPPLLSRAESPLKDRMIFCFGARRSGTYLLQRIVGAHPLVSQVPSETHIFSHGLVPLLERFRHEDPESLEVGSMYVERRPGGRCRA